MSQVALTHARDVLKTKKKKKGEMSRDTSEITVHIRI